MRQAWHIFQKDVRHLRLEIALALVAVAVFAFTVARGISTPLAGVLPVVWWILIARAVHAEPLPGVRQFWVTRPYAWKSLLAAKALFIAAFVNLPMLIADVVILHANGFGIASQLGGLLWTQVLLVAAFALPVAALAVLTSGFSTLIAVSGVLIVAAAGSTWLLPRPWLALEWLRSYLIGLIVAIVAAVIVLRQYRRKNTTVSRILAAAALAVVVAVFAWLPWRAAFAVQSRLPARSFDASAVRIGFHPDLRWATRAFVNKDGSVELDIPLRLAGIPETLQTRVDGIAARIEGPGGGVWREQLDPWTNPNVTGTAFHATVDSGFYKSIKDRPVRISGAAYLTLYGNPRSILLPVRDRAVYRPTPGAGLCAARQSGEGAVLNCRSAFGPQRDLVSFDVVGVSGFVPGAPPMVFASLMQFRPISYSPFPADADLIPVTQSEQIARVYGQDLRVKANALEPVAHIRKEFTVTGLRLADYEVRR
ncbi:MAG: hypothetical protein ACM3ZB_01495 [bacterium]